MTNHSPAMTEGRGTGVSHGLPQNKNKKKKNVNFSFNFSHLTPSQKKFDPFLDFMAISNKKFWSFS
jgi:hypothetical protein